MIDQITRAHLGDGPEQGDPDTVADLVEAGGNALNLSFNYQIGSVAMTSECLSQNGQISGNV